MPNYDLDNGSAREDLCRYLAACYYQPGPEFSEEKVFDSMLAAASLAYTLVHADKRWILGHPAAALLLFLILLDAARESAFDHPTNWRG